MIWALIAKEIANKIQNVQQGLGAGMGQIAGEKDMRTGLWNQLNAQNGLNNFQSGGWMQNVGQQGGAPQGQQYDIASIMRLIEQMNKSRPLGGFLQQGGMGQIGRR